MRYSRPRRIVTLIGAALVALASIRFAAAAALGVGPIAWEVVRLPAATGSHPASFAEPGIAVGPRGALVVNAAQANVGYPTWWTSADNGAHWGRGQDFDPSGAMTGDADAAFGPDGSVYVLNLAFNNPPKQPVNPTVLVYASRDGEHFSGPASFPAPHGTDQPDRPWLVPDPSDPNHVLVTNSEGAGDVVAWTSTDHAQTFTGPTLVTGADHAAAVELTSRPLFDPTDHDRLFMLYEASSPTDTALPDLVAPLRDFPLTQLWMAESSDAGASWTNRLVLDITDSFGAAARGGSLGHITPASAIDAHGIRYAAFSLRLGGETETHVFLIHSRDHGGMWSEPVRVDTGSTRSNVMPAIAVASGGRVDVSWYGSDSSDFIDPEARWIEMFGQSLDALDAHPDFTTTRIAGVTHVGSIDCSGNPGSNFYDWGLRDFQSIAIDAHGMAHLAWADTGASRAVVARQISGPSVLGPAVPPARSKHAAEPPVRPRLKRTGTLAATGLGSRPEATPLLLIACAIATWLRRSHGVAKRRDALHSHLR